MDYFIYLIVITLITAIPQVLVNNTYNKYAKKSVSNNKTGVKVVQDMFKENGINNVEITNIRGKLTDYYDSKNKKIALSTDNYNNASVASIAVAAHETGHAIQDHKGYFFFKLRSALVPTTVVASKFSWIAIYVGFLFFSATFIWIGIGLLAITLLFSIVTLPVEFNASNRAIKYLKECNEFDEEEIKGAKKVLIAAALTYVASTLAGLLQLIRLITNLERD